MTNTRNKHRNGTGDAKPRRPLIGEAMRRRAVQSVKRCMHAILIAMNREHERCGVTRCKRARRCRGTACGRPAR